MKRALLLCSLAACAAAPTPPPVAPPAPRTSVPAPPVKVLPVAAPKRPVVHTYHGTSVTDDYEWLEDGQNAEVKAFTDAQNSLARATLDALPERANVRARALAILGAASTDWVDMQFTSNRLYALKEAPPKQQRLLVELGTPLKVAERVIVDPNTLDPSGKTTIDFYVPSPDARIIAVSLSKDGTESGDVHLFDAATGKDRDETIPRVHGGTAGGSLAWNADGTGFFYTRYPRSGERPAADLDVYQQVYFHKLGTPESADTYAIGKDFPRIAEVELSRSEDGKRILAHVANGDGGEVEHHVFEMGGVVGGRSGSPGRWTRLSRFEDELTGAELGPDGKVYAIARKGAPRGRVVVFSPPFDRPPTDVLPEGDAVIEAVRVTKSAIYTVEIVDGPSRVRRFPLAPKSEPLAREPPKPTKKKAPPPPAPQTIEPGARGHAAAVLPLPSLSSVSSSLRVGEDLLLRVESHVEPARWVLYRANEHRLTPTALAKKAPYETSDVEVVRETCTSKDGTKVPMTVLRKHGTKLDGSMPGYLSGYGGFGIVVRPRMRATHRIWLDSGGVVAEANLRGGGERGEAWHRAGSLTKKQNVFDDFAACAQTLVDRGYTKPERLAISGRSNGGLLMGAVVTQHPELYRAVSAAVGLYDMLKSELTTNGAFNVTEYGTVKDEAQFRALYGYSPFHNVKDGTAYPAMLFMTGANDPRVDPFHSRKMVARLQSATTSNHPILLRASADTGHGIGMPLSAEIEEMTDSLAFLLHEVGAVVPAATARGPEE